MDQDSLSNILEAVETAKVVGEAKRAVVAKTSRSLSAATMEPEPTPLSDQDKIRLKRIAKLSQSVPPPSSAPSGSTSAVASTSQRPTPTPAPVLVPAVLKAVIALPKPKGITIHPAGHAAKLAETFEDWEHGALGRILRITLDRETAERSNWTTTYLKELAMELVEDDLSLPTPIKLSSSLADQILLARLSLSPESMTDDPELITVLAGMTKNQTLFEYLSGCWKRERAERSAVLQKKGTDAAAVAKKLESLNVVKALVVSYTGLVLIDGSMFPQDHITTKPLGPTEFIPLLVPSQSTSSHVLTASDVPSLLNDLAIRFTPSAANDFEDASLHLIVGPVLETLGRDLFSSRSDIGGGGEGKTGWRESLSALSNLTEVKGVAGALPLTLTWSPASSVFGAPGIEVVTTLGPWLRLSAFPDSFPAIAKTYFPNPSEMSRGDVESAWSNLRGTLRGLQNSQFQVLNAIVRSSPASREAVLDYFGQVAQANVKRAAIQVDLKTVSSHGFMINLFVALLGFAGPFMDAQYSKIDKIDPLYYKYSSRIDVREATKMSATQQESDAYYAREEGVEYPKPNFISEIFFLCCVYLHIGPLHTIKEHKDISRQISQMKRQLGDMEADTTWRGTPQAPMMQAQIDRYKKKMEEYNSELHAMEVQLLDPEYLTRCVGFINLVMAWLVRLVDPKQQHPGVRIGLPLPAETPEVFKMLPEYLIEDITELLTFVSKYAPHVLAEGSQDELMTFMLVFLSTPYMKNPYLKGQFVEIMYYLTRPMQRYPRGSLGDVINFHPLALKNLMFCLCNAYVEIEITGSHTQFYDKFNTRYYITQLFKLVWSNPSHREALRLESLNLDRYVRFVNLLMNDTTFLLEESLIHLGKILEIQKDMDDKVAWDAKPAAERQETEKLLRQYEGTVRSDLDLGTESLRLLKLFTAETREPFLTPEIVDRLAAMLDYNLDMLAGPKCQDLRVRNPEEYKFRPKDLLSDVLQIYLHLGPHEQFRIAVAKDGRSYSKKLFDRAEGIARRMALKVDKELEVLGAMVAAVEVIRKTEEEEDAMGELPDEYLDPLTYDLMRDPVLLPSSKTIVDRSTIKQHYLSDATDPFNRVPLQWDEITDATELRLEIEEFLRKRKEGKTSTADVEMVVD